MCLFSTCDISPRLSLQEPCLCRSVIGYVTPMHAGHSSNCAAAEALASSSAGAADWGCHCFLQQRVCARCEDTSA